MDIDIRWASLYTYGSEYHTLNVISRAILAEIHQYTLIIDILDIISIPILNLTPDIGKL